MYCNYCGGGGGVIFVVVVVVSMVMIKKLVEMLQVVGLLRVLLVEW